MTDRSGSGCTYRLQNMDKSQGQVPGEGRDPTFLVLEAAAAEVDNLYRTLCRMTQ